jgi:uncharacterized protein YPO0396
MDKKNKQDNIFKPIDLQSLEKGFRERDFEAKERQDIENLKLAVEFIRHQIDAKREQLKELEMQVKDERFQAEVLKKQLQPNSKEIKMSKDLKFAI